MINQSYPGSCRFRTRLCFLQLQYNFCYNISSQLSPQFTNDLNFYSQFTFASLNNSKSKGQQQVNSLIQHLCKVFFNCVENKWFCYFRDKYSFLYILMRIKHASLVIHRVSFPSLLHGISLYYNNYNVILLP